MTTTIFVPRDSTALALGADEVAQAIAREAARRGDDVRIVRNGSRGMFWLEPLVELRTDAGRVAYGPVTEDDVAALFDADFLAGGAHPLAHGPTDEMPFLKNQERLTFARVGITDPLSLDDYIAHEGFAGLTRALSMTPAQIVQEVLDSGLRGRGGAAFPTGIKWKTVLAAQAPVKYIVCNADEGDSGTFSDRMVMEDDPFMLIEGMTIAGLAVGAEAGYIYTRSEYPHAIAATEAAIEIATQAGWLGDNIRGSGRRFRLEVRKGAGAYVCGEETALLESLEGKRGVVRAKPPLPALKGLFGQPTVINNVISLATVPVILARGAAFYQNYGMGRSRGTLPFQLAGNIRQGGLVEKAFGITLRQLMIDFGGGAQRPGDSCGPGGRAARRVSARGAFRYADRLRSVCRVRRRGRPWRHRGVRRNRRHGEDGALRDAFLRDRIVRQVHAMPDRLHARRRGDRPHHRRRRAGQARGAGARPVRHDAGRVALRDGRHDALSGAVRAE